MDDVGIDQEKNDISDQHCVMISRIEHVHETSDGRLTIYSNVYTSNELAQ